MECCNRKGTTSSCCCWCGNNEATESANDTRPKQKYRCLRKFLAVTCSQLGLLVLLVLYLIGGTFLFNYLERENHQARLDHQVSEMKTAFDILTGFNNRAKRSSQWGLDITAEEMSLKCVNLQLATLLNEIARLNQDVHHEKLQNRLNELREITQEVTDLMTANDNALLSEVLEAVVHINLTSQIRAFQSFTMQKKRQFSPESIESEAMLSDFVRAVYKAIRAGWVPPPRTTSASPPTTYSFYQENRTNVRAIAPTMVSHESVLKTRLPRTDPWTMGGSLFYVFTVVTTIGNLNNCTFNFNDRQNFLFLLAERHFKAHNYHLFYCHGNFAIWDN